MNIANGKIVCYNYYNKLFFIITKGAKMKKLNTKQVYKSVKFNKVCVSVSTCLAARGGGAS